MTPAGLELDKEGAAAVRVPRRRRRLRRLLPLHLEHVPLLLLEHLLARLVPRLRRRGLGAICRGGGPTTAASAGRGRLLLLRRGGPARGLRLGCRRRRRRYERGGVDASDLK